MDLQLPSSFGRSRGGSPVLTPTVEKTLYRILQEGLTNVAKHARATTVSVVIQPTAGGVRAIVEDDGQGFPGDPTAAGEGEVRGLGLHGIQERVAMLRGSVFVESSPAAGSTLVVDIPLEGRNVGKDPDPDR